MENIEQGDEKRVSMLSGQNLASNETRCRGKIINDVISFQNGEFMPSFVPKSSRARLW